MKEEYVDVPYQIANCLVCGCPIMNMCGFPHHQASYAVNVVKNKDDVLIYGSYGSTTMDGDTGHIIDHDFLDKVKKKLSKVSELYICDDCVKKERGKLIWANNENFHSPYAWLPNSRLVSTHPTVEESMIYTARKHDVAAYVFDKVGYDYILDNLSKFYPFRNNEYELVYDEDRKEIEIRSAGNAIETFGSGEVFVIESDFEYRIMSEHDFFHYYQAKV